MKYIVIGLGNYGSVLAEELTALGHEVIGADRLENRVDVIKDKIATAFVIDAADDMSLSVLPLNSVDAVIVTIGENFGASIRVTALLKQHGVKHIYARAIDEVHKAILQAFDLDKILTPEEDAAYNLVGLLNFGTKIESFQVDKEYWVAKFGVPEKFIGYSFEDLSLAPDFKLKIIALIRSGVTTNFLGLSVKENTVVNAPLSNDKLMAGDELVCYGKKADFQRLWKGI